MPKITDAMIAEHKRCDEMFIKAEEAIANGDWEQAATLTSAFEQDIEKHFLMEETILFPAYAMKTEMSSVTQAMMMEHMQMRQLIFEIEESIKEKNQEHALGVAETLLTMMKQHNRKEERKMYVMADSALRTEADELLSQMGMA
ncbi:MAG: hemerythrin domain-containing protein [Candidatus Polarisedimenticolaceae bacterium]|nr:hemerythrin domain-containing protein [Candidatus Polarisedimenticolaceae bacterium]